MFGLFRPGVPVREMGDFDLSDMADERFWEVRRSAGSIAAASGCAAGRPFASAGACAMSTLGELPRPVTGRAHLLPRALCRGLDAIPALDNIRFQADGTRPAVELEKQAARVAEDGAGFVATPERGGACGTVLAHGLSGYVALSATAVHVCARRAAPIIDCAESIRGFFELTGALAEAPPGVEIGRAHV